MAGKQGRSGRPALAIKEGRTTIIRDTVNRANQALNTYVRYLCKLKPQDISTQQAGQLLTIHMKHTPDPPKQAEITAIEVLGGLVSKSMDECKRVREASVIDIHSSILDDSTEGEVSSTPKTIDTKSLHDNYS